MLIWIITVGSLPHGRCGVKILPEWLQQSQLSASRSAPPSSERFYKEGQGPTRTFVKLLPVCSLPGRDSPVLLSCVTWGVPTPGGRHWKCNEFKENCTSLPFGVLLGKADRKKTFKEITPRNYLGSLLQRTMTGMWRYITFLVPMCHASRWPQPGQRWRNPISIWGTNAGERQLRVSQLRAIDVEITGFGGAGLQCLC